MASKYIRAQSFLSIQCDIEKIIYHAIFHHSHSNGDKYMYCTGWFLAPCQYKKVRIHFYVAIDHMSIGM